jgi:hypothetical protein
MITPKAALAIYEEHKRYWKKRRPEMRRLRNAYMMRYWQRNQAYDGSLLIETSRAYELIESFIASLFVRDPSVVVKPDLRGKGDPGLTEETANEWLVHTRTEIEDAMRLALIYPWAAIKLCPTDAADPLRRVQVAPVGPWDVLVDDTASSWSTQRFVGHRYYLPLVEAKKRYGNKKLVPRHFDRFLENNEDNESEGEASAYRRDSDPMPKAVGEFIMVVEFYDLMDETMKVWSPDYAEGKRWLYDGIELEVGADDAEPEKFDGIPYRTASDRCVLPLIPLYMSREPDDPLRGYSALRRVYDQLVEINTIRTFQANGIRRAARQWMVEKGVLDEEAQAKLSQGQDGEFIEVELSPGQELGKTIVPVPHNPVPHELQVYESQVEDDFSRGSIMAPFTRGEATKATATEITALAAYSASEIGRMARERDAAIGAVARAYTVMLATLLGEESVVVRLGNKPEVLQAPDLTGDFTFYAQDSGSTPMSEAVKKQELMQLVPQLVELGVTPDKVLRMIVRTYDLSEELLPEAQPELTPAAPDPTQAPPPVAPPEQGLPGMGLMPGQLPSPEQVAGVLPPGGVV